jgi:HPt (histidine-containing phosphotransfer) domain-containing protein
MTFHADVPQHADMAARLAPIRAHFIGTLPPRRERLTEFLGMSHSDAAPPALMRQLQEDAHKIRGVAPTLGFERLGRVAAVADELLDPWHHSDDVHPVTDQIIASLVALLEEIETTLIPA